MTRSFDDRPYTRTFRTLITGGAALLIAGTVHAAPDTDRFPINLSEIQEKSAKRFSQATRERILEVAEALLRRLVPHRSCPASFGSP